NGKVTTSATCSREGVRTYTCKNGCGTTQTEPIAAKTHFWSVATYITAPTCTTTGLKSYYCLYQCGETKTEVAAALGHDYVNNVCQREGCGKVKAIYAADYGVKGDGVTNDGPAISRAVNAAKAAKSNLIFEPNKTYYISSSTNSDAHFDTPFTFHNAEGFTVDGQGSTFLMAPHMTYFNLWQCSDFTIKNCNFDYAVSVYLVGTVKSISGNTLVFSTDIEPYQNYYDYTGMNAFSVYKYDSGVQGYPHAFIKTMTKTASKEVTVTYSSGVGSYRVGQLVYLPNPGIGHVGGESIFMGASKGAVTLENIEIRAARSFVFHLNGNAGETYLNNVDIVPGDANTRAIKMVGWRDGFHCKDNRGAIHWTDCENGVVFDDVMNVRNNLGYITSVTNAKTFAVVHYNNWQSGVTTPLDCKAGDVLDFYDQNNDVYYGYATVQSVTISNNTSVVTLSSTNCTVNMTQVNRSTCRVANRNTCAPGSTITNCEFSGSLRLNREITVTNTKFNLYYALWILAEGGGEGPLPGNITFRNCTFRYAYVHIDGYNRWDTGRYMPNIASHITGIRAYDCTFENGCYVQSTTGCVMEKYVNGVLQIDSTSLRPSSYVTRSDYKTLTASELSTGYTFDFSTNKALLFSSSPTNSYTAIQRYTTLSKVNTAAAAVMREAGFGENVFFYNDSVYLHSLTGMMQAGKRYQVTMKVYDCTGNLTTLNPADSMVLLKMANGVQSEGQVNYVCTADPSDKRLVTLTFTFSVDLASTNDFLLFYRIGNPTEFYIGSLSICEVK
ncbi:MAG: hypothetical protein IJD10_01745, partial [Clostridia bacterium]|nr:hypothetical protein [Clostridia bacterium]